MERKFKVVYSRNNLLKINDKTYVINLDEYKSIGTHWIALYVNGNCSHNSKLNNVIYFDSFRAKHIPKEIKKVIGNKNITTSICRIQVHDSIICIYFCIRFIDFKSKGKILNSLY